jgi:hypothetical protein
VTQTVLTEAFMTVRLTLAAGQAPDEEHPDAPEAGRSGIFGESGARLRALGQALGGAESPRGSARSD